MLKIELYQDGSGAWRWRALDSSLRVLCEGADQSLSRAGIERVIETVMTEFRGDVSVVMRDRRLPVERRGREFWDSFDEIAMYIAEGAKHG
jgi:hypothetical protein